MKKRIISIALILTIALALIPMAAATATASAQTDDVERTRSALSAYRELLTTPQSLLPDFRGNIATVDIRPEIIRHAELIDFDGCGIPELVITMRDDAHGDSPVPPPFVPILFLVIGYTDQAVVLRRGISVDDDCAGFSGSKVRFTLDGQIFFSDLAGTQFYRRETLYELSGGQWTSFMTAEGVNVLREDEYGDLFWDRDHYINGRKVSNAEFDTAIAELGIVETRCLWVTTSEVSTLVANIDAYIDGRLAALPPVRITVNQTAYGEFIFDDVNQNHWARYEIIDLAQRGIINGFPDGTFRPEYAVTREQFARLVIASLETPAYTEAIFADVPVGRWSNVYITAAVNRGIILPRDYGENLGADLPITREEAAVWMVRALAVSFAGDGVPGFYDLDLITYRAEIAAAVELGLIMGLPGNLFMPTGTTTRAQAAVLVTRLLNYLGDISVPVELDYETIRNRQQLRDWVINRRTAVWDYMRALGEPGRRDYGGIADRRIITYVMARRNFSFAIDSDGTLFAWGSGLLGDGENTFRFSPVRIMDNVVSITDIEHHHAFLAVTTDNVLWGWGWNSIGILGDGTTTNRYYPVRIMDNVVSVTQLSTTTFVITTDGVLWAWGPRFYEYQPIPAVPIVIMEDVIDVALSAGSLYVLTRDGALWSFGNNILWSGMWYDLDGAVLTERPMPVKIKENVISITALRDIAWGVAHAITNDGILWRWYTDRSWDRPLHPEDYEFLKIMENAASIYMSSLDLFFLTSDGSLLVDRVYAWDRWEFYASPVLIKDNVKSVTLVHGMNFAITTDGSLWGFGANIGDVFKTGIDPILPYPVQYYPILIMENIKFVTAHSISSSYMLCQVTGDLYVSEAIVHAITTDGELLAWGGLNYRFYTHWLYLENGMETVRWEPVRILFPY